MKIKVIIVSMFLAASAGGARADAGAPSVHLLKSATINTMQYRLGDVAQIRVDDAALKGRLEAVTIGVTPRLGYTEYVSRQQIEKLVAQSCPDLRESILWAGSDKVGVRGAGTELDLQPHVNRIRELILSQWHRSLQDIARFDIQPVQDLPAIVVPRGTVKVESRIAENAGLSKRLCAWLDVAVDGKHYQTIPVWFSVKAYKPVLVAKKTMTRHQNPRQDDFIVQVQDIAGIPGTFSEVSRQLTSAWLKRPLREGEVLTAADLEEMPLVRRGENVRVTLAEGPVQIETEGVAQVHGRMGDIVRVQNLQTSGIYTARVTGVGAVTVKLR
jgi:flagella basal body P-ring formation protein FlgA